MKTSQKLAEQYGINEKTIRRDAEFAKGVESLSPKLKRDFLNGNLKVSSVITHNFAKLLKLSLRKICPIN